MLISLAISLAQVQSLFSPKQQSSGSSPSSQEVQRDKKDSSRSPYILNEPRILSVQPVPLPAGDNAWAVHITSTGGISGTGRGNVTLTSDGQLLRNGPAGSCSIKLSGEALESLTRTVFAANGTDSSDGLLDKLICPDCYVTAMVVTRRRAARDEATIAVGWTDATEAKVAADVLAIYQAVMANKDCKLQ
jgi:hypothetical protein